MKPEIASELERIREEHDGILHPRDVVRNASEPTSPLHPCFTWDDGVAAHNYRVWQARKLIEVVVTVIPQHNELIQAYVSMAEDRRSGGGYRAIADVLSDDDQRARLLTQALRELNGVRKKYNQLKALSPVFAAIDKVEVAA